MSDGKSVIISYEKNVHDLSVLEHKTANAESVTLLARMVDACSKTASTEPGSVKFILNLSKDDISQRVRRIRA